MRPGDTNSHDGKPHTSRARPLRTTPSSAGGQCSAPPGRARTLDRRRLPLLTADQTAARSRAHRVHAQAARHPVAAPVANLAAVVGGARHRARRAAPTVEQGAEPPLPCPRASGAALPGTGRAQPQWQHEYIPRCGEERFRSALARRRGRTEGWMLALALFGLTATPIGAHPRKTRDTPPWAPSRATSEPGLRPPSPSTGRRQTPPRPTQDSRRREAFAVRNLDLTQAETCK